MSSTSYSPEAFFRREGWEPFGFQRRAWDAYRMGKSGLIHAPTGFGKTWAAYLGALEETVGQSGCAILWITPLRALAADTLRALRKPVEEFGLDHRVEARTGDSTAAERRRLREQLPHTLVTTPESLSLLLTHPDTCQRLGGLRAVIVDEWHELIATKRGVQTELCLARLRAWLPDLRIWGLSATLGNLGEARCVLLGSSAERGVLIGADEKKEIEVDVIIPDEMEKFPWAGHLGTRLVSRVVSAVSDAATTLVFTNTRSQTEIWFQELGEAKPEWKASMAMHHGSLDSSERRKVENDLREGVLRCVVATSSLDLGVDFSPVDQVIQIGSPKGIARLMQRAGRAGHKPGLPSRIVGVPTHALELVEFAAARDSVLDNRIESRIPLCRPLDVLAQHLVTCCIGGGFDPEEMRIEVMSAYAFADLRAAEWDWVLGFISTGGSALSSYSQYQKAQRDEDGCYRITDKKLVRQHRMSIGTITSDPAVSIRFQGGRILGTVEEGFVGRLKPGSVFIFGGRRLELIRLRQSVATVKLSTKKSRGHVAIWGGSKMPLSGELSRAVSIRLSGGGAVCPEMQAVEPILQIQSRWSEIPSSGRLLVEFSETKEGRHLFVFPMAGRLVHEGLAALMAFRMSSRSQTAIQTTVNDYGFSLNAERCLSLDETRIREALSVEGLYEDLMACMNTAELARRQFREIARVAGLVMQSPPKAGGRANRDLMASASLLYEVLDRYDPENLLLDQAKREILERQLELTRLRSKLDELQDLPFVLVETNRLTPMAFPLWAERIVSLHPGEKGADRLVKMLDQLEGASQ